jgi:O-antigen/teichoic acid export membrane protein
MARSSAGRASRQPEIIGTAAMLLVMAILLATFALLAPILISIALGPAYLSSVLVFRIYLLVVLINAANQPLLALLQADGHEHYAGRLVLVSAVMGLVSIAAGSYFGGAAGAAMGAVLVQLFQVTMFGWKALQQRHRPRLEHLVATDDVVHSKTGSER